MNLKLFDSELRLNQFLSNEMPVVDVKRFTEEIIEYSGSVTLSNRERPIV